MRWEYSEWDQTLQDLLKSFQDLMSLFNYLMLMAGGDVDKVFKWMEYLQERWSLDPDVDLAEFRPRRHDPHAGARRRQVGQAGNRPIATAGKPAKA